MRIPIIFCAVTLLASCAPSRTAIPGDHNPYIISEYELRQSDAQTAYEAVQRLRPNFLNYQPQTTVRNPNPPVPVVYLDEQFAGDLSALNHMLTSQIENIRFYRSSDAMIKYGMDRTGGVISVTSKK